MKARQINIVALLFFVFQVGMAQTKYTLDHSSSNISIAGTSNLHDWEMKAIGMTANIVLDVSP
ncbi:MAG: hypothetical protein PF450_12035, partial [Bacteroidales bacterium]|nr:hypothetical protein [Bacteroidales bacterium]